MLMATDCPSRWCRRPADAASWQARRSPFAADGLPRQTASLALLGKNFPIHHFAEIDRLAGFGWQRSDDHVAAGNHRRRAEMVDIERAISLGD